MAEQKQATAMSRLSVASLMSPPEGKPMENFNSTSSSPSAASALHPSSAATSFNSQDKLPLMSAGRKRAHSQVDLPSPPVTPATANKKQSEEPEAHSNRDPVLFHERSTSFSSEHPLFEESTAAPSSTTTVEEAIDKHIASRASQGPLPTHDDYHLFQSCVYKLFNTDTRKYLIDERERNDHISDWILGLTREEREKRKQEKEKQKQKKTKRQSPVKKNGDKPSVPKSTKPKRTPKNTPKQKSSDSFDSSSPRPAKQRRTVGTTADTAYWTDIADVCPPPSAMPEKGLRTTLPASGGPIDLSDDPDRELLVPTELALASTMRLPVAKYLLCKRRIFLGFLNHLRQELEKSSTEKKRDFNKTAAQNACRVDVNKASGLWDAYKRAGWFDKKYFEKYL